VLLYAAGCIDYRNVSSPRVAVDLLGDNAFLGIAAVGATFVILSGGIDLSVGAVVAFTGVLIAALLNPGQKGVHPLLAWLLGPDGLPHVAPWLISPGGVHPLVAILIALVLGSVFGAAMGALIHFFRLPPFLVTLAGMFFARGMGFVIYPQSLGIKHPFYVRTINQDLALRLTGHVTLPFTAVCFVAVLAAAIFLAHYTRFGRSVYAIGGDEQSATLMGLAVGRTKILIYTFAGF
jgi:simple sugar transport system permease protein